MNDGLTLVLDKRTLAVRLENGALRVEFNDGHFQRVPTRILERVIVHGAPSVRCDVWRALAASGVPAALLPGRGRGDAAWVGAGLAAFVHWRIRQHRAYLDEKVRIAIAREVLTQKLETYIAVQSNIFNDASLKDELGRLKADLPLTHSLAALMGVEGWAARVWYSMLANKIDASWGFTTRNRRPPRDPINALLSLSYTLITGAMRGQVLASGLDPSLGFLHEVAPAREALILDLVEPLRAGADAFVIGLTRGVLAPEDFTLTKHDGCRLNKPARSHFYGAWEVWCRRWPGIISPSQGVDNLPGDSTDSADYFGYADSSLNAACLAQVEGFRARLAQLPLKGCDDLAMQQ